MAFIQKNKVYLLIFILLALLRFVNLGGIPIFGDEGLYLWLSHEIKRDPSTFLKSISFGILPLAIWLDTFLEVLLGRILNPLILGRSIQIIVDLINSGLVFFIARKLFDKRTALIALFIYLALPLTFFNSRFALLDPLTNLFSTLSIFFALKLKDNQSRKSSLTYILLLTISLILGFFTKPLAVVSYGAILSLPILTFQVSKKFSIKESANLLTKILMGFVLFGVFLIALYLPISKEFTSRFVSGESHTFTSAISHLKINLWRIYWWSKAYLTMPFILTTIGSVIFLITDRSAKLLWLLIWLVSLIFLEAYFSANFFPRHILLIGVPVSIISAYFLTRIFKRPLLLICILILILIPSILFIVKLLTNPVSAPIALEDRQQFFEDWTSGEGFDEVAKELKSYSSNKKVDVYFENDPSVIWTFNNLFDTGKSNILKSKNLSEGRFLDSNELTSNESYIVLNKNPQAPDNWPVSLVFTFPKGSNRTINIYKIKSF